MNILTIHGGKLVVMNGTAVVANINTVDDYNRIVLANGGSLLSSSSVDHPEEYTDDPDVVALADLISRS